ncbi:Mitochondrial carrier domain protein [Metarhizium album ARSEF 1941]|uniref:Mitochondrial carrier domain protein n=1 Tax=Metarhizium album (strain ARSEF 1941) TaxID=1081103 RepID=A0A0B2X7D0_METAS|nr:Mitochondrial carrier domain protein [Metarhizium album ARSEF 1941]KHO01405.1 Mitochondrial carrier domain protein [Metarhizium album ARSEF 1941]
MATLRDGVNPLRPYYRAPVIGETADSASAPSANPFAAGNATGTARYASKARDVLADIDYRDYLSDSSPSVIQNAKELVEELIWKYTSVLMAQPFEVAKTILQARDQDDNAIWETAEPGGFKRHNSGQEGGPVYDYLDSDSEGDEPAFFTSNAPGTPTPSYSRRLGSHRAPSPRQSQVPKRPMVPEHYLAIRKPDSILDVIAQLWQKDGAWGVWKGSNATFLYSVLQSLLENWSRSFVSAIFNVPDLGVKDDIDRLIDIASPYPWASLFVAATAAVATGVLLSPLDLVRTRLIMTPVSKGQRRTLANLRDLPSYLCPSAIALPTVLNSLIHPLLTLSTPLVLRTRFLIDSQASPMTFSVAKFFASSAAILIKLPIETTLRRGQMAVLSSPAYTKALGGGTEQKLDTIVPIGRYNGIIGTMYHITSEEGSRENPALSKAVARKGKAKNKTSQPSRIKGQGLQGLWRGWKVNWWGLVGLWTANVVGNGGEGEF